MIQCHINGKIGYPDIKSEIKVTKENPYLKNGGSYTMDVSFPMSIPENAALFANLHRMDVSKADLKSYDDCILYVDNLLLVRGSGRVTEVTETTVKLQILGGYRDLKYKSKLYSIYLDRIDSYPVVDAKYQHMSDHSYIPESEMVYVRDEIRQKGYVGDKYQYVFMPTYDIDNDVIVNFTPTVYRDQDYYRNDCTALMDIAVQPNLMMVLRCVLEYVGYKIEDNVFDTSPWNELIIANVRQTKNIAYALPHWSVATFLDEFRNLFNASFIFDEENKTVRIVRNNELDRSHDVAYEVADEYKTNYDDDGVEYLGGSNIKYDLQGGDRTLDDVPADVLQKFEVWEYETYTELLSAFAHMTEEEKFTHVFSCNQGYFFYGKEVNDEGDETGNYILKPFGIFGPLYRDVDSESFVTLRMAPANMLKQGYELYYMVKGIDSSGYYRQQWGKSLLILPAANNPNGNEGIDYDEKGYVSVSDVLENGEDKDAEETEEDSVIPLVWVEETTYNPPRSNDPAYGIPLSETDYRNGYQHKTFSLALENAGVNTHYIGELHRGTTQIETTVDTNNEVCFQFLCESVPDPTAIYIFRNKRYLCGKIEIKATNNGVDRMKTGYFHEIKL